MSTKFSKNSPVQKPPSVCRKPPDPPRLPVPPLNDRILIAYVAAYWPVWTPHFNYTGYLPIYPTGVPNVWGGLTQRPDDNVKVAVIFNPTQMTVDVEIQLRKGTVPINTITFYNMDVIDTEKFGTRMAEAFDKLTSSRYQTQVFQ